MNSFEISSSGQPRSQSDIIHEHNMRVYDAEMAEFEASCPRRTACNLGVALVCAGTVVGIALPPTVLGNALNGVMAPVYVGIGITLCVIGGCAIGHADSPTMPTHPDFREETSA